MQKPKQFIRNIAIAAGSGGSRQSSGSTEAQSAKQKPKILHPPIEYHWHLPALKDEKGSVGSRHKFKRMLSYPLKLRSSLRFQKHPSKKVVLEGVRNPKDQELVDSFRQMLLRDGLSPGKHYDYHTLLRFLRMRDFNLPKAREMFLNYLKWREEYGVDVIAKEFRFDEYNEVKKCYPHGFHGVDRYGRPVYIERLGMVNVNALLQITTIERLVKYHVSEQEKTLNWRFPACSLSAKKHIASTMSILDVRDVGPSNFSKPARQIFLEIQKIDSNYYPETLHRLFIINAGSGFKVLWTAIKAFLEPRTVSKIKVLGTNYLSNLIEAIDPSNLPTFLGGNCTCSDSGGCLFSDKGPWNDPEIIEILQAMLASEDEGEDRDDRSQAAKEADVSDDNVQVKDVYDVSPTPEYFSRILREERNFLDQPHMQKIKAFEALLTDAKTKIEKLESALEDTKLVLRGLTDHMKELKMN